MALVNSLVRSATAASRSFFNFANSASDFLYRCIADKRHGITSHHCFHSCPSLLPPKIRSHLFLPQTNPYQHPWPTFGCFIIIKVFYMLLVIPAWDEFFYRLAKKFLSGYPKSFNAKGFTLIRMALLSTTTIPMEAWSKVLYLYLLPLTFLF